jgi:hypothetical protein
MTMATGSMIRTVIHADLSGAHAGEDYHLFANGDRIALRAHTSETRAAARNGAPHLADMPEEQLTHFTEELELRDDCALRVHLAHTTRTFANAESEHGAGNVAFFVPPAPGTAGSVHLAVNYESTVRALLFHHPDLATHDPEVARIVHEHMDHNADIKYAIKEVATRMRSMGDPTPTDGWARQVPNTPPFNARTGMDGKATRYEIHPTPTIKNLVSPIMTMLLKATKNDHRLEGKKWRVQPGQSVAVQPHAPHAPHALKALATIGTDTWSPAIANTSRTHGLETWIHLKDANKRRIEIHMRNYFIRYLGAFIRFFDANDKEISDSGWRPDTGGTDAEVARELGIDYSDMHYLGYLGPVDNIFAIPIESQPGSLDVTVTFPENAVRATLYGSGLGTGRNEWPKSPLVGGILTGFVNIGIPGFMLAYQVGSAVNRVFYKKTGKVMESSALRKTLLRAGFAYFAEGMLEGHPDFHALVGMQNLLFNEAATEILLAVEEWVTTQKVLEAIPFAGWVLLALEVAVGAAQIAQTIIEVTTSPWNIDNKVATTITSTVTIHPDPRHLAFPQGENASYTVRLIYESDKRPTAVIHHLNPPPTPETLTVQFPNNTLGGKVRFEVDYLLGNWMAGQASSGSIDNDEVNATQVDVFLVEIPKPLRATTVYKHEAILQFDEGNYLWQPSQTAPTATQLDVNPTGNAIGDLTGVSLSQRHAMIGFSWQAAGMGIRQCGGTHTGQLYAMMNVDIPGRNMVSVKFPDCGFDQQTQLLYDPFPAKFLMNNGQWVIGADHNPVPDPKDVRLGDYYLDPRPSGLPISGGGGIHLRRVVLDASTRFDMSDQHDRSYGRFDFSPDDRLAFAMHPAGFVIGVSKKTKKMHILAIAPFALPDEVSLVAFPFAGEALNDQRHGLLFNPIAATCSYDGTIFILEEVPRANERPHASRVQAFDLYGNPVSCFRENGVASPFLRIGDETTTVLDIAAVGNEVTTYLYVLYYRDRGLSASDYHVSIFCRGAEVPPQQPLLTTDGVAAARITVDMWHTLYTLNYAMTTNAAGAPSGPREGPDYGPAGMTVPSLSEWIPKNG